MRFIEELALLKIARQTIVAKGYNFLACYSNELNKEWGRTILMDKRTSQHKEWGRKILTDERTNKQLFGNLMNRAICRGARTPKNILVKST